MHVLTTSPALPTGKLGPGLLGLHAAAIATRLDDPILSVRKGSLEALGRVHSCAHHGARLSPQVRKGSLEALGRVHPTRLLAFAPAIALRLRDPILSVRLPNGLPNGLPNCLPNCATRSSRCAS